MPGAIAGTETGAHHPFTGAEAAQQWEFGGNGAPYKRTAFSAACHKAAVGVHYAA